MNTSPVVGLFEDANGAVRTQLAAWTSRPAEVDVTDDDGVRHRLWAVPADGEHAEAVAALMAAASSGPIAIADGHHRYETALRYRDERRMSRSCEEDPAFDYLLMLFLPSTGEPLTVLPTHRVVRGLGDAAPDALLGRADSLFDVEPGVSADELRQQFGAAGLAHGGEGRFGVWTRSGGARLTARREAFGPFLPDGGQAMRELDVTLLGVALERLGVGPAIGRGRCRGLHEVAAEAIERVDSGSDDASVAFLLEPTPVASIEAVARDGDVMPQKSTYFYPKALTGLVINPHEW